jgi:hypothetical protein
MLTLAAYDRAEMLAEQKAGPPASADERWWHLLYGAGHHG